LLPKLQEMYRTAPDPGLHAAAEWLLRTWKQEAWLKETNEAWATDKEQRSKKLEAIQHDLLASRPPAPRWYVKGQEQTMVVIPGPVEFAMGSPATEEGRQPNESQHKRRIGQTYALAAKSVTVREFRRFLRENKLEKWFEAGGQVAPFMKKYSPDENGPIILVDWYKAAAYCNWLSAQEGIAQDQWCYETNARKLFHEKVSVYVTLSLPHHPLSAAATSSYFLQDRQEQVTALRKNYLRLRGYRLPTEAEMEYACRAGAVTSRYYGETEELLAQYAWYQHNSKDRTWPVGSKKPNDLGLFDMHGNVLNWCQESSQPYSPTREASEDKEDSLNVAPTVSRVMRGCSFLSQASFVRSANHFNLYVPTDRLTYVGFRAARTLPLSSLTALPPTPEGGR